MTSWPDPSATDRTTEDWVDRPDAPVVHVTPGSSDTAIVAFSARRLEPGRFHFFNLVQFFPEPAKLLIRDPSQSWYNTGLPGIGDTVQEIAGWIGREVDALGAKRVLTMGYSMGGYAAILFGCLIGAERAIAFTPQTLLDSSLHWLVPPADVELQVPDLIPVIRDAPQTGVDLVIGAHSILDVFHAQRVAPIPSVRVLSLPDGGHNLVVELNEEGRLWPLIGELIENRTPSGCELSPELAPEVVERIGEAIVAWGREDWVAAEKAITPVVERHPDWPAPRSALAKALAHISDPDPNSDAG